MIRAAFAILTLALTTPVAALDLSLPANARQTVERNTNPDVYDAPIGVFAGGVVPKATIEGNVRRGAWRLNSPGLTPLQVIRPLRSQLIDAGFEIVLDCRAMTCGGFDFRFAVETLPGPNMYVNIRAYQFVTGVIRQDGRVQEAMTLLASTSASSAYVQVIHAGASPAEVAQVALSSVAATTQPPPKGTGFGVTLMGMGHAVLGDLDFETGSTDLGEGPFETLAALATLLKAQPTMRVALVGHTDTVGGLAPNIAISRARARSVRQRLIESHAINPNRLDAEGMGYLAPVASNLDSAGRDQNRRVEVVILALE